MVPDIWNGIFAKKTLCNLRGQVLEVFNFDFAYLKRFFGEGIGIANKRGKFIEKKISSKLNELQKIPWKIGFESSSGVGVKVFRYSTQFKT